MALPITLKCNFVSTLYKSNEKRKYLYARVNPPTIVQMKDRRDGTLCIDSVQTKPDGIDDDLCRALRLFHSYIFLFSLYHIWFIISGYCMLHCLLWLYKTRDIRISLPVLHLLSHLRQIHLTQSPIILQKKNLRLLMSRYLLFDCTRIRNSGNSRLELLIIVNNCVNSFPGEPHLWAVDERTWLTAKNCPF